MERRNFLKTAFCLSCLNTLSGCSNVDKLFQKTPYETFNPKESKFYYKSKADLPKSIRLEACSLCQLNCPACSVRNTEKQAPKDWLGYLKFKDFKKFVDDNCFKEIELSNSGEIFLNPELDEIIKYASYKKIRLTADSGVNLNNVSDETLENLVKYRFRTLRVSIDGATQEVYRIYRRGGDLNVVFDNIKKINYYKQKYNSKYPRLNWQFILFGHNEHEIELAKKKAQELNMTLAFKRNNSLEYSPIKNKKLVKEQTGLEIYSQKDELVADNLDNYSILPCLVLFKCPQIDYNGDFLGCCKTNISKFNLNVFKQGLLEVLNSYDVCYVKHILSNIEITPKKKEYCFECEMYKSLKRNKHSLTIEAEA